MNEMELSAVSMSLHEAISHLEFAIDKASDASIRWVACNVKPRNQFRGRLRMARVRIEQALEMLIATADCGADL